MSSTEKAVAIGRKMAATAMASYEMHDGTEEVVVVGQKTMVAATAISDDTHDKSNSADSSSSSYTEHDTLGLHYDDEPNKGGVLPNATASIKGGVSVITQPEMFPVNHVKIMPSVNEKVVDIDNNVSSSILSNRITTGGDQSKNSNSTIHNDNNALSTTATASSSSSSKTKLIASAKHNLQAGKSALEKSDFDTAAVTSRQVENN